MPRTYESRYAFAVDYLCDKCNEGYMRWGGMTLTTNPPWYPHVCDKCDHQENMRETYPHMEYRSKPLKARRAPEFDSTEPQGEPL